MHPWWNMEEWDNLMVHAKLLKLRPFYLGKKHQKSMAYQRLSDKAVQMNPSNFRILVSILILCCQFSIVAGQSKDIEWLRKINLNRNKDLDPFFKGISHSVLPLTLGFPMGIGIYEYGFCRSLKQRRKSPEILAAAIGTVVFSQGLKWTLNRERPYEVYPDLEQAYFENDPSMPSGHTASAFALATSATLNWPKWYVGIPAYLWAGSVGYSRMHLALHYPSDVVAGALLGSGSAYLCHYLNDKFFQKREKTPKVKIELR